MGFFKRLCLFVVGLSSLAALVVLSLTWVGPWTTQFRSYLELRWFFLCLEVLVCIGGLGALACVLASLLAPRNPRESVVAEVNGGTITVTRSAIVSQTKNVIEADGTCIASSIRVRMRKRGNIRVNVRVTPRVPVDVVERGEALYAALGEGLSHVCGNSVKSIELVFAEPEQPSAEPFVHVETESEAAAGEAGSFEGYGDAISVPLSSVESPVVAETPVSIIESESDSESSDLAMLASADEASPSDGEEV